MHAVLLFIFKKSFLEIVRHAIKPVDQQGVPGNFLHGLDKACIQFPAKDKGPQDFPIALTPGDGAGRDASRPVFQQKQAPHLIGGSRAKESPVIYFPLEFGRRRTTSPAIGIREIGIKHVPGAVNKKDEVVSA